MPSPRKVTLLAMYCAVCLALVPLRAAEWKPVAGQLLTRWAAQVDPARVLPEYPRPQLQRSAWQNLNGLWDYAIAPRTADAPERYDGQILVPFPIESALSGVKKPVQPDQRLWYRRTFQVDQRTTDQRVLLHFERVDWETTVWVNGQMVGQHRGGYDTFSFDITETLRADDDQEVVVAVWDPTDQGFQPRGKQVLEPRGIWYTAVTGIWDTVWLEVVPAIHIQSLKIVPDIDQHSATFQVGTSHAEQPCTARVTVTSVALGNRTERIRPLTTQAAVGTPLIVNLTEPKLWSPTEPWLYQARVTLFREDQVLDEVDTYFGMRKIAVDKAVDGFQRMLLNNQPLFQYGPLDQGWWPDGLYRAPTDEALRYDVDVLKKMNCNMIRKHVKIEPARWYYHCDRLGMLVWQDMPSGDKYIGGDDPDLVRSRESAENYRHEYETLIRGLGNHPCIVVWVPFNEGWGQFDTDNILQWTKQLDPHRLVDGPSGWADRGSGDLHDMHRYPGPGMPEPEPVRAVVLGEFGGLGLPVEGHLWWNKRNWGYRTYGSLPELQQSYETVVSRLRPLIGKGLSAAVYTQTTDVEGEVNGLMTYDRAVIKQDVDQVAKLHGRLYLPPPVYRRQTILPTSEQDPRNWRYRTSEPGANWMQPDFDDSDWQSGPGGFGRETTPGAHVRTPWEGTDIWLRSKFTLATAGPRGLHLRVHHDEDAEVYLNGTKIATLGGFTTDYEELSVTRAGALLRAGENTLAVHCHQTRGGQYIDVGLADLVEVIPAK